MSYLLLISLYFIMQKAHVVLYLSLLWNQHFIMETWFLFLVLFLDPSVEAKLWALGVLLAIAKFAIPRPFH